MKMFMTRIGEGSKMVITGDPEQVDLPGGPHKSGLVDFTKNLRAAPVELQQDFGFVDFIDAPVVRHPIIPKVLAIYAVGKAGPKPTPSPN